MKRSLFIPIILGTVGLLALPQQADASYVCTTAYYPTTGAYGNQGYVHAFYSTLPDCQGDYIGARYYCSPGNTATQCHPTIEYPREGLLALYQAFVTSIASGLYAHNFNTACNNGASTCGGYVQFDPT